MAQNTPQIICFGLNEKLDRESFNLFLRLIGREEFTDELSARISIEDIDSFTKSFITLLKKYLSEAEYHELFLGSSH